MQAVISILLVIVLAQSCNNNPPPEENRLPNQKEVNKSMEEINRQFVRDENLQIDGYIERHGWEMTKSPTGLRYMINQPGEGPLAQEGQIIQVAFVISLLDGEEIYSTQDSPGKDILIGQDNVESGLHEAFTYLRKGDHATIILPSYLAHGLTGDGDKIPPRSSVVYDVIVLDIQ